MMARFRFLLGMALLLTLATGAQAQVTAAPSLLNFQGRLAKPDGTPVADGNYAIRFSLWTTAAAGSEKWNQTVNPVTVKNGAFAVLLNLTSGFTSGNDLRTAFNGNTYLEIKIGTDTPLTPRQQIVSTAYALRANSVPDGSINTDQLANNAVNSAKIADGVLTAADLASDSASLSKVSNGALSLTSNRLFVTNGVIQKGGSAVTTTGDLGLYSQVSGGWMRFVTNAAPFRWYLDSGGGTTPAMSLLANGHLGLGTDSPSQKLTMQGGSFLINNTSNSARALLGLNSAADSGYMQILGPSARLLAGLGGDTNGGQIYANNGAGAATILLNGSNGEITGKIVTVTGGSDVAEPYNVAPAGDIKPLPGMVVCIDGEKVGQMKVAGRAYDTTVAGILSGANGIRPGITLTQKGTVADGELPVASIGRVWCWCDADASGPIVAGDLLTTSDTPGHAMKAVDKERRDGAVIGKAMSSLKSGKGLVLVLVSLK